MAGHSARPLFLPHRQPVYVAVRPFTWKGELLQPGDEVPQWPKHHLRHLHTQSMIGPLGHNWTEQRIACWDKRIAKGAARTDARRERVLAGLKAAAEAADEDAEEATAAATEAHSLKDRIAGFFGGGDSDGRSAGPNDSG